ncbi:hypothetical protein GCM10008994_15870 [Halorubrum ejinorense]|uniref:Uncharacterized protein n=1 Tax=Halorubrum ejinorense TaxID=425309 RepID=A0AAV3SRA0_9EURY
MNTIPTITEIAEKEIDMKLIYSTTKKKPTRADKIEYGTTIEATTTLLDISHSKIRYPNVSITRGAINKKAISYADTEFV